MRRKLVIFILVWFCFILQTTVFGMIDFLAAAPNLMLILTVSIGFMQGRTEGMFVGFACGLLTDLFYGDVFGFYALLYLLAGYFCGRYSHIYFDDDVKIPLLLVAGCDLAMNFTIYLLRFLLRGRTDIPGYLRTVIFPDLVCTLLFTLLLYRLFYRINHFLLEKEKKGKQSLWIRE